jgi:hypothetical protein
VDNKKRSMMWRRIMQPSILICLLFHALLLQVQKVDAGFTKMCSLDNAPVPLEYDAATGRFSLMESMIVEDKEIDVKEENNGNITITTTDEEEVRQLKRTTVHVAEDRHHYLRTTTRREEAKRVYMARSCPCSSSSREPTYCLVEGLLGTVHDTCGVTISGSVFDVFTNITTNSYSYDAKERVECLKLETSTVFIRNAWPIIVFWYGALLMFLIATENGRYVRRFVLSKCFPTCRINDRRIEGVVQREIEHRERIRAAAMRAAMLADGPAQYLLRTRGMRNVFSNEDGGPANGDQTMQRWIAQAESLGISHTMRPTEFVLQTRKFNSKHERARRKMARLEKADEGAIIEGNLSQSNNINAPATPTKIGTTKENVSTPETVATCDDCEDNQEVKEAVDIEQSIKESKENLVDEDDDESFDCTICLASVDDGDKVGILPCSHIFHAECLAQWIQRRNVCPLCQTAEIASPRAVVERETSVGSASSHLEPGGENEGENNMGSVTDHQERSRRPLSPLPVINTPQRLQLRSSDLQRQQRRRNQAHGFP